MNKKKAVLLILCGLPFAGKTTVAKMFEKRGFIRITVDDINTELGIGFNLEKRITYDEWVKAYAHYYKKIRENLLQGKSVICDGVAYMKKEREELREIAITCQVMSYVLYIPTDEKTAKTRWMENKKERKRQDIREDDFEEVINHFQKPTPSEHVFILKNEDYSDQAISRIISNL